VFQRAEARREEGVDHQAALVKGTGSLCDVGVREVGITK
jgi:hypothetical protein